MPNNVASFSPVLLIHGAQQLDHRGVVTNAWLAVDEQGMIAELGTGSGWQQLDAATVVDAAGSWLTPGFIDMHSHGGAGCSVEQADTDPLAAIRMHREHGVTGIVLSLVSAPIDELCDSLRRLAAIDDPAFLGVHLEGPFLSPEFKGAHDESALVAPTPEAISALLDAANGTLRQITLAPELPGALAAIAQLTAAGVRVAVGHTAASAEQAAAAFDAGASILTHTFNGMPGLHHRAPGPLLAAFERPGVTLELILDGVHVDPALARWVFDVMPDRVALISDAMAAAGHPDGDYRLGGLDVTVLNGVARLARGGSIAGSTLTLDRAFNRALSECGLDPVAAITAVTQTPARALGLDHSHGEISIGRRADLLLITPPTSSPSPQEAQLRRVWTAGLEVAAVSQ